MHYLLDYLFEAGPTESNGMGPAPLTWQEMDAWARRMPRGLQPWEFVMLRRLSFEFCAESHRATDPDMPPPWRDASVLPDPKLVADRLKAALRGMR